MATTGSAEGLTRATTGSAKRLTRATTGSAERIIRATTGSAERLARATTGSAERITRATTGSAERLARATTGSAERLARATTGSAERLTLAVIVPALDEAGNLPGLFRSLGMGEALRADPSGGDVSADAPDEVLVADGGSTDGTRAVARRYGARVVPCARGRGVQLAAGARAAGADLLLFLHADTRVCSGSIAAVRAAFAAPGVVATGMRQRVDGEGRIYRWIERAADRRVSLGWVYGDSGLCVRRSTYDQVGGFREQPLFEDLDLSRRLRRRGRIQLVEGSLLLVSPRRWQQEGALRHTVRNWVLTAAWALGMDPVRLERFYRPHSEA